MLAAAPLFAVTPGERLDLVPREDVPGCWSLTAGPLLRARVELQGSRPPVAVVDRRRLLVVPVSARRFELRDRWTGAMLCGVARGRRPWRADVTASAERWAFTRRVLGGPRLLATDNTVVADLSTTDGAPQTRVHADVRDGAPTPPGLDAALLATMTALLLESFGLRPAEDRASRDVGWFERSDGWFGGDGSGDGGGGGGYGGG